MRNNKGQFINGYSASPETQFKKGEHWRTPKAHWDKEWLSQKYIVEELSTGEIAEMQSCTDANILYWMKKHGIERRSISEVREIKHWGLEGEQNGMYGVKGEDNPNWKGGLTPERQAFYSSIEWKEVSGYVRDRDNNTCQQCGEKHSKNNILHIHHIVSFSIKELRADPNNLILLCNDCHYWIHSNENIEGRWLG